MFQANDISTKNHGPPLMLTGREALALFLESSAATAASDGDFSFAPGNPKLLATIWALKIAMLLVTAAGVPEADPLNHGAGRLHKFHIFFPSARQITGEQTEQRKKHQNQA
ncbi:MAG: hypothetical protein VB071_06375 [Lawsonibacter sp.]|nr:hypothetical protein [Lawsonibacter sp.]